MEQSMKKIILEMKDISKSFGGVHALNTVNLTVHEGEIHALIGENGAGKSTLMKILLGLYKRDAGAIVRSARMAFLTNTFFLASCRTSRIRSIGMSSSIFSISPGASKTT